MANDYTNMLAPPDHTRKVPVPNWAVKGKLEEGYIKDDGAHVREAFTASMPGRHKGRTAFVAGCGPSMGMVSQGQIEKLIRASKSVVWAVNDVWKVCDGQPLNAADYLVVLDEDHWTGFRSLFGKYLAANPFCLPVLSFDPAELINRYQRIGIDMSRPSSSVGEYEMGKFFYGESGGIAAIQMAMHCGCDLIYLLGHDLTSKDGRSHGWGARRTEEVNQSYPQGRSMEAGYAVLRRHADELGIRIVNLSPISILTCFEKSSVEAEIKKSKSK